MGGGLGAARWSRRVSSSRGPRLSVLRAGPGRLRLVRPPGPQLTRRGSKRHAGQASPASPFLRLSFRSSSSSSCRRADGLQPPCLAARGRPDARTRRQDERLLAGRAVLALLLPALPEPHRRQAGLPAARAHLHGAGARAARPQPAQQPSPRSSGPRRARGPALAACT